uniref:Berberine/berberine-like domain-containing protein n=1 Tax=Leersia perrieri TaxID=77586 RepID=A0A0D9X4M1_9ORYZ
MKHRSRTAPGSSTEFQYGLYWDQLDQARSSEYIEWLHSFYMFMAPHVSKDPRGAYANYMDMDLGTNNWTNPIGESSIEAVAHARSSWGASYFGNNFDRLVRAKTMIDPGNVFNNAQSIPPLY